MVTVYFLGKVDSSGPVGSLGSAVLAVTLWCRWMSQSIVNRHRYRCRQYHTTWEITV